MKPLTLLRHAIILSLLLTISAVQAVDRAAEYKIKTAYLYNFAKFVKWPEDRFDSSDSKINICIINDNPFGNIINVLHRKTAQGRQFNLKINPTEYELNTCHMMFFPRSFTEEHKMILNKIKTLPVVTVGEGSEFAEHGGIIAFVVQSNTVTFELNLDSATTANISVSSKLAEVASRVITK